MIVAVEHVSTIILTLLSLTPRVILSCLEVFNGQINSTSDSSDSLSLG